MARSNKIALMAAPLCAAALLVAPAWAGNSLFDSAGAAPSAKPFAKVVKPKPVAANVQPAPEPAPLAVQEPEPATAFGQPMPRQSLINRFANPARASDVQGQDGPAAAGKPAEPVAPEEETLPNGMPKKFLLNRMFNSSALEPARQPDPRSFMAQAQTPAAEPSLFDRAAGALGFGGKEEKPAGNLPPVIVTAPAKPDRKPKDPSAVAAPAPTPPAAALLPPPAAAPSSSGFFGGDDAVPDYSERPKIAVPQNRDALPPPRPGEERRVQRPPNAEALTRPPAGYTEKVQGADGSVSGLTDKDEGKKGFFNWF